MSTRGFTRAMALLFAQSVTAVLGGCNVSTPSNKVHLDMKLKTSGGITHAKAKIEYGKTTTIQQEKGKAKYVLEVMPERGPLVGKDGPQFIKLSVKIQEVLPDGTKRVVATPTTSAEEDKPVTMSYNAGSSEGIELIIEPSL